MNAGKIEILIPQFERGISRGKTDFVVIFKRYRLIGILHE